MQMIARLLCLCVPALLGLASAEDAATSFGVPVSYQLPTDGPLPRTCRVTLAIVEKDNPDWILSEFVAGGVRTVTAENQGKFTDIWDGLDDNHMPVPPGTYGVKGIVMPARQWQITGEYHTLTPKLLMGAGDSWFPTREQDAKFPWMYGAGVGYMGAIDVAPNGKAAFFHSYIENATNPFLVDLNKPIGWDQVLASHQSGGAAGGWSVATDGELIWCACNNGGIPFVYRADGRKFGTGKACYRRDVYVPDGEPSDLAAWRDPATGKRYLYIAQEAELPPYALIAGGGEPQSVKPAAGNKIVVLDGETAAVLGSVTIPNPRVIQVLDGKELAAMHLDEQGKWAVSSIALKAGLPDGPWRRLCGIEGIEHPSGFAIDSQRGIYVSDLQANQVYKLDAQGKIVRRLGRGTVQRPGHYDERVFMSPGCLAVWKDQRGNERLLVAELAGPNRVGEWTPDGKLVRQWFAGSFGADWDYAIDPEIPEHLYVATNGPATGTGLVRYLVNYKKGTWQVDAVWPSVCYTGMDGATWGNFPGGSSRPKIIDYRGHKYLTFARTHLDRYGYIVYRQDGDDWLPSAGLIPVGTGNPKDNPGDRIFKQWFWWNDANGDGKLQEAEYEDRPANLPGPMCYWGNTWLDDLSLTWMSDSDTTWRIAPAEFDKHGNPVFDGNRWQALLVDTVFRARKEGKATALHGGNELATSYPCDWQSVDGSMADGFYVNARGGIFDANYAPQYKISRYVPDGKGGFAMKWRVGRAANGRHRGSALPGEIYGTIYITKPINGIFGLHDSTAGLYHLYTTDGMYVDTLFYDDHRFPREKGGAYSLSGENFGGHNFLNRKNGKVYVAMTTNQPCALYEVEGWTATENPVKPLTTVQPTVTIRSSQIASPPELALKVRGGAGIARVAKFQPAAGGPSLDGSMAGWEGSEPVRFQADDKQQVEVRCMYDPRNLYLRWQVRLGRPLAQKPLQPPERIFTHDRAADTLSFYIQADPMAKPGGSAEGRPGDVRIVFGLFTDAGQVKPAALGLYPKWLGSTKPTPLTYGSAVAPAPFEHVAILDSVRLGHKLEADGQGFVLAAAIPRDAIPQLPELNDRLRTMVNFEATLAGQNKFWWANSDGSASQITHDEPSEARLYPGSWAPAQFISIQPLHVRAWSVVGPFGFPGMAKLDHVTDRPQICKKLADAKYPPEEKIDLAATYTGDITSTRVQQRTLRWKPLSITDNAIDLSRELNWGYPDEGVGYAVTYLNSPAEADLTIGIADGHGLHVIRGWLNAAPLPIVAPKPDQPYPPLPVHLKQGWNELLLRFDHIWGDKTLGLRLEADPAVLWSLRTAASSK